MAITPAQCRAARALVEMSQAELAASANVGLSTVRGFENGTRAPIPNNIAAIEAALKAKGVMFFGTTGVGADSDDNYAEARLGA